MAKAATKPANNKASQSKAVGFVASSALSLDVGLKAIESFKGTQAADAEIAKLQTENKVTKYETLKSLTMAFIKAAQHDPSIKLHDIHSDKAADADRLRDKLNVAVGIKTATKNADGTDKIAYAPAMAEHFPMPGEDKTSEDWRRKETFRGNFGAVFKKAIVAADAVVLKALKVEEGKDGVLLVSGKAIKERFNVDQIALNEKKTIETGKKDAQGNPEKLTLAKIPSYTELGRISAESAGTTITTRVDSRAKLGGAAVTEKDIVAAVDVLQAALLKIKNFSDEMATKLEALQDTIEKVLSENEGTSGN